MYWIKKQTSFQHHMLSFILASASFLSTLRLVIILSFWNKCAWNRVQILMNMLNGNSVRVRLLTNQTCSKFYYFSFPPCCLAFTILSSRSRTCFAASSWVEFGILYPGLLEALKPLPPRRAERPPRTVLHHHARKKIDFFCDFFFNVPNTVIYPSSRSV